MSLVGMVISNIPPPGRARHP